MKYQTWVPLFNTIKNDLSLSWDRDEEAAKILSTLLREKTEIVSFSDLHRLIKNKEVVIVGAGPQLEAHLDTYKKLIEKCLVIAADGSTSALLNKAILPSIIVTDFDGNVRDQLQANDQGSVLVAHAHGDNIAALKRTIPLVRGKIIGSIQTDPTPLTNVFNVGGFTDGDRAIFLADHCGANTIYVLGFDFSGAIGHYSLPEKKDLQIKRKKIIWCHSLITQHVDKNRLHVLP